MKNWKHLTFEQRKVISSGISHGYKLKDIGENLLVDPTSVSKEVKRNRIEVSIDLKNSCKRTERWPYVCTGCKNRYNNCPYTKYKYDASKAQEKADMIAAIAENTGVTKADAEKVFNATFELFKDELSNGNKVSVAGFGTFKISERAAREGRNPQTGETIHIKASKSVSFKAGTELKSKLN